jgi:hypothetical protein
MTAMEKMKNHMQMQILNKILVKNKSEKLEKLEKDYASLLKEHDDSKNDYENLKNKFEDVNIK